MQNVANGKGRHGDNCHFSHDIISGRCKREESGECTYKGCWYGHLWDMKNPEDMRNRQNYERHTDGNVMRNYDNNNNYNRVREERRNKEQPVKNGWKQLDESKTIMQPLEEIVRETGRIG